MKTFLLIVFITILQISHAKLIFAQSNSENLVMNASFEAFNECPRDYTQWNSMVRYLAEYWSYPTKGTPDLFNRCSKSIAGVPNNFAGQSEPYSGNGYIGMVVKGSRRNYREYAISKLRTPMIAGVKYCVSMKYKLSRQSKYSVDNLGIYFSQENYYLEHDIYLTFKPQIQNKQGYYMDSKNEWHSMCGTYVAQGGEQFITLGNFYSDDSTLWREADISDLNPKRVKDYAYYYIDDVEVTPIENCFVCECSMENRIEANILPKNVRKYKGNDGAADLIISYGASPFTYVWSDGQKSEDAVNLKAGDYNVEVTDVNGCKDIFSASINQPDKVFEKIEIGIAKQLDKIYFQFDTTQMIDDSNKQLNDLLVFMEENPTLVIQIIGHTDSFGEEDYNIGLSTRRAGQVVEFLIRHGIDANRLSYIGKGEAEPVFFEESDEARQKNRRVEFMILRN